MRKNKKIKKTFSFFIALLLFLNLTLPVQAAFILAESITDTTTSAGTALDKPFNSAQNDTGGFGNKQQNPKVDVKFSTEGLLRQGARVTATAIPSFFNSVSGGDNLYYTWYLKRSGCGLTEDGEGDIERCDEDNDGKVTENDWKITAARIIARGDFDSKDVDYGKDISSSVASFEAVPNFDKSDGWRNGYVENGNGEKYSDNDESADNCYVQVPNSGTIYELRKTEESFDNSCPDGYHRSCVTDQQANCQITNPDYSQSDADAAASAIPPEPYDVPKSILDPVKSKFNACAISSEEINNNFAKDYCDIKDLKNFEAGVTCNDVNGQKAYSICMKDDLSNAEFLNNTTPLGVIVGKNDNDSMCTAVANPVDLANKIFHANDDGEQKFTVEQEKCSVVQGGIINGTKDAFGNTLIAGNIALAPKCQFKKGPNLCKHLFPRLPKSVKNDDGGLAISGDGEFNIAEKEFWKLDPAKASTNGSGKKDEEVVIGRGINTFKWLYSTGDKIGVVVEGESTLPTQHSEPGNKIMWAFSKGKCDALDKLEKSGDKSFYIEGSSVKTGFLTADIDLNDCLKDNLLEMDEASSTKMTVTLDANPKNATNDPDGNGDILSVAVTATNIDNAEGLTYKWSVQKSNDGANPPLDTTSWLDITKDMLEGGSFNEGDLQGLAKNKLDIKLNIKDIDSEVFYLKIKAKVIASAADGRQDSEGSVVVRVKQQENVMRVYPVSAADNGMLSMNKGLSDNPLELCSTDSEKMRCFVSKNQIVALEVTSPQQNKLTISSWKVNGNPMICLDSVSTSCSSGNKLFLPILGNEGEAIDVEATGMNQKGDSMQVSRRFIIGSSQLSILPVNSGSCSQQCLDGSSVCPKYLGHYNDLNGGQYSDCSDEVLETRQGNIVTFQTYGQIGFDWTLDGEELVDYQNKNQIQLKVEKAPGESYNIGVITRLLPESVKQKNDIRKALYRNWGVSPEEVTEEVQNASIQLNVVEGIGQEMASGDKKSMAASLITHLPEQMMFLFKIFLTSATLLISMSLLFALMPEAVPEE